MNGTHQRASVSLWSLSKRHSELSSSFVPLDHTGQSLHGKHTCEYMYDIQPIWVIIRTGTHLSSKKPRCTWGSLTASELPGKGPCGKFFHYWFFSWKKTRKTWYLKIILGDIIEKWVSWVFGNEQAHSWGVLEWDSSAFKGLVGKVIYFSAWHICIEPRQIPVFVNLGQGTGLAVALRYHTI